MPSRPLILVTVWRRELPTFLGERTRLDTLDPAYAERVAEAGGQPLLVSRPPRDAERVARELVGLADGVVITGGGDVVPATYGAVAQDVADEDAGADAFELAIVAAARAAGTPMLGVCRGAELLAVAHGGRLGQRVPDGHGAPAGSSGEAILATRHPVSLAPGSRIAAALGGETAMVNTIHHHVIADAGELRVTARAPDGPIEAVEPTGAWECVGVQWHPEKMDEPEQRGLFSQLLAAAGAERGRAAA